MILTPELEIARVNEALCVLLGRSTSELVSRSLLGFTHPDDVERTVEKAQSVLRGEKDRPLLKRYVRPDGSSVETLVTGRADRPGGL